MGNYLHDYIKYVFFGSTIKNVSFNSVSHQAFLCNLMLLNLAFIYLGFLDNNYKISCDIGLLSEDSLPFQFCLDSISLSFLFLLCFSTSLVLYFCCHYYWYSFKQCFTMSSLLALFSCIVWLLTASSSLLLTLIWWDYVGILSFFLILSNNNPDTLFSSFVTLFSSRCGDVCLYFLLGLQYSLDLHSVSSLFLVDALFIVIVMTKSASYPFTPWLIEAMRAPTVVSALVHSSTLVTAGVWFFCRYGLSISSTGLYIVWPASLIFVTILYSGVLALCSYDLKKIIAYSTCNNISWSLLFCLFGWWEAGMCQLFIHGVLKCLCFVYVGCNMQSSGSAQIWQSQYSFGLSWGNFLCIGLLLLGLGGFPCFGCFFMKHFILECFSSYTFSFLVLLINLCALLSSLYVSRLFCLLLITSNVSVNSSYVLCFGYWLLGGLFCIFLDSVSDCFLNEVISSNDVTSSFSVSSFFILQFSSSYVGLGKLSFFVFLFNWKLLFGIVGLNNVIVLIRNLFLSLCNPSRVFCLVWEQFIYLVAFSSNFYCYYPYICIFFNVSFFFIGLFFMFFWFLFYF